jgi:beta-glucosidase
MTMTLHASPPEGRADGPAARAAELLAELTVEEKVGQMHLMTIHRMTDGERLGGSHFRPGSLAEQLDTPWQVGGFLSGGGGVPTPNSPTSWAELTNELQRYAIDRSRLRIPLLYGTDGIHGHNNVLGATIFPYASGIAASWHPALAASVARSVAAAMRATGVNWNFAPAADVGRDPRWGRFCETYGEDPTLVGAMAAAVVEGSQGTDVGAPGRVAASAKHFIGYGAAESGLDRLNADLPLRALRDRYLPPFRAAIAAGAATVMVNSGAVNGVPVHASRYLLTDVLRGELGFAGLVVSDWGDVLFLRRDYGVVAEYIDAVELAVNAGVDMVMAPFAIENLAECLLSLLAQGRVSMDRIDEAVLRVLTLKFALGLFENPFVDERAVEPAVREADRDVARQAAREGIVLLRNRDAVLPLADRGTRVLVTGPAADSVARLMGGLTIDWQGVPDDPASWPPCTTIAEGIRAAAAPGCARHIAEVTAADLAWADVVVAAVGEKPYTEFAGDDRRLELARDQQELLVRLAAAGKPVVAVLVAGRPLDFGSASRAPDALLMAHLPGTEGGSAVADVLYGEYNPSGRLPYTWPKSVGQLPMTYDQRPAAADGATSRSFRGPVYDPEFEFGAGLSYTTFEVTGGEVHQPQLAATDRLRLSIDVVNTGDRYGTAVIPVFVSVASAMPVAVPERRLLTWARVELGAGEKQRMELETGLAPLDVTHGDVTGFGVTAVPPGDYRLLLPDGYALGFTVGPGPGTAARS